MKDGDVLIALDGKAVPLTDVTWVHVAPCGCYVGLTAAALPERHGMPYEVIAATAEQAARHTYEDPDDDTARKWAETFIDDDDSPLWQEVTYWRDQWGDVCATDDVRDFRKAVPVSDAIVDWQIEVERKQGFTWKPIHRHTATLNRCEHVPKYGVTADEHGQEMLPV
jgi:hypothetical protein